MEELKQQINTLEKQVNTLSKLIDLYIENQRLTRIIKEAQDILIEQNKLTDSFINGKK